MNMLIPKQEPLRDRKYLNAVRDMRCIISGRYADDYNKVEACHIGTLGRGIKSPDNHVLPMMHEYHQAAHNSGEISFLRQHVPGDVLRDALKLYAERLHEEWKNGY